MKVQDKLEKHVKVVVAEMCKRVETDFETFDFEQPNWYWERQWTKKQEDEFTEWMAKYLFKNSGARQELMNFTERNKENCLKAAKEFVWDKGWKIKE